MEIIHQGDQYYIPIKITLDDETIITPSNVSDVRVKVNDRLQSYSQGQLSFNEDTSEWLYWLTQEQTRSTGFGFKFQVGIKAGSNIIFSDPQIVKSGDCIIREAW